MKIAILGNASSIHVVRWANGLANRNLTVHVISAHKRSAEMASEVNVHELRVKAPLGYVAAAPQLRKLLKSIQPEILNAHYATGYGLLARLSGYKPLLLSVWGSDIYLFPNKTFAHRALLRGNLKAASAIASTSLCMAGAANMIFPHKKVYVTPFGIDELNFLPSKSANQSTRIVIGTVKSLKHEYGIDTLINAFSIVLSEVGEAVPIFLEITGAGRDLEQLRVLATNLGISNRVIFHGQVPHSKVPEMLARLDIYVALSRSESFGVAILEASACEKPVVVSDADGPKEVTLDGKTGFVVKKEDPDAAAEAIAKLIRNAELRSAMGRAGRDHVLKNYTWNKSIDAMLDAYTAVLDSRGKD